MGGFRLSPGEGVVCGGLQAMGGPTGDGGAPGGARQALIFAVVARCFCVSTSTFFLVCILDVHVPLYVDTPVTHGKKKCQECQPVAGCIEAHWESCSSAVAMERGFCCRHPRTPMWAGVACLEVVTS